MRIKLDENLPAVLAEALAELGHDADTVQDEDLSGRPDDEVWKATQRASRFLITQDLDFSDLRARHPSRHPPSPHGEYFAAQLERANPVDISDRGC